MNVERNSSSKKKYLLHKTIWISCKCENTRTWSYSNCGHRISAFNELLLNGLLFCCCCSCRTVDYYENDSFNFHRLIQCLIFRIFPHVVLELVSIVLCVCVCVQVCELYLCLNCEYHLIAFSLWLSIVRYRDHDNNRKCINVPYKCNGLHSFTCVSMGFFFISLFLFHFNGEFCVVIVHLIWLFCAGSVSWVCTMHWNFWWTFLLLLACMQRRISLIDDFYYCFLALVECNE